MTSDDIQLYLRSKSDAEIIILFDTAKCDLASKANSNPNSEWHESCFAAVIVIGNEALRRGIAKNTVTHQ